ncbi:hypothetical protein BDR06DRAFT_1007516 [Suillus hirtellus]|nr:hypothetical protein BDR06DRAFT_1007516 [Suillus hirtellus]
MIGSLGLPRSHGVLEEVDRKSTMKFRLREKLGRRSRNPSDSRPPIEWVHYLCLIHVTLLVTFIQSHLLPLWTRVPAEFVFSSFSPSDVPSLFFAFRIFYRPSIVKAPSRATHMFDERTTTANH